MRIALTNERGRGSTPPSLCGILEERDVADYGRMDGAVAGALATEDLWGYGGYPSMEQMETA